MIFCGYLWLRLAAFAAGVRTCLSHASNSAPAASWAGRGARSAPSACGRQRGPLTGSNPTNLGKGGSERIVPVVGYLRCHHARHLRPAATGARDPARPLPSRPALGPGQVACGQGHDYDHPRGWLRKRASTTALPEGRRAVHTTWAATAGSSRGRSPGWPDADACTAATNAATPAQTDHAGHTLSSGYSRRANVTESSVVTGR